MFLKGLSFGSKYCIKEIKVKSVQLFWARPKIVCEYDQEIQQSLRLLLLCASDHIPLTKTLVSGIMCQCMLSPLGYSQKQIWKVKILTSILI